MSIQAVIRDFNRFATRQDDTSLLQAIESLDREITSGRLTHNQAISRFDDLVKLTKAKYPEEGEKLSYLGDQSTEGVFDVTDGKPLELGAVINQRFTDLQNAVSSLKGNDGSLAQAALSRNKADYSKGMLPNDDAIVFLNRQLIALQSQSAGNSGLDMRPIPLLTEVESKVIENRLQFLRKRAGDATVTASLVKDIAKGILTKNEIALELNKKANQLQLSPEEFPALKGHLLENATVKLIDAAEFSGKRLVGEGSHTDIDELTMKLVGEFRELLQSKFKGDAGDLTGALNSMASAFSDRREFKGKLNKDQHRLVQIVAMSLYMSLKEVTSMTPMGLREFFTKNIDHLVDEAFERNRTTALT